MNRDPKNINEDIVKVGSRACPGAPRLEGVRLGAGRGRLCSRAIGFPEKRPVPLSSPNPTHPPHPAKPACTPKEPLVSTRAKNQLHIQDHRPGRGRRVAKETLYNSVALPVCSWPSAGDRRGGQVGPFPCQGHFAVSTVGAGLIPRGRFPAGLLAPCRGPRCPRLGGCTQHSCLLLARAASRPGQRPLRGHRDP